MRTWLWPLSIGTNTGRHGNNQLCAGVFSLNVALILTRPGGLGSLLVAMFLGVPMCEIASLMWVYNPLWALPVGAVAGLVAWGLFIRPVGKLVAASPAPDPFDRLYDSPVLAWAARIGLTLCLVTGLQLVTTCVEFFLMPECDMPTRHSFMAPVYRTMCIPWVGKVCSGAWVVLAVAASSREIPTVAASVRFFNQVSLLVLAGALLLFRRPLSTMTDGPFYWSVRDIGPLWLYFSAASLAAAVLVTRWEEPANGSSWRVIVLPVAVVVGIGSLIPAAFAQALRLNGGGLTGSIDFAHAMWFSYRSDPVLAGKGLFLILACFAWAQVVFLVIRGIWSTRALNMGVIVGIFALLGWRPWLEPHFSNWRGSMDAAAVLARFLSVLVGIVAGRALMLAWMKSRTQGNLARAELIAASAGGIVAVCAIVWPNTALDLAPFVASFVLMVSVGTIRSGPNAGLRPNIE